LGLFSLVTVLALQLRHDGQIPLPVTAWYHTAEPTFADCLAGSIPCFLGFQTGPVC
jgi:hypothetical protein